MNILNALVPYLFPVIFAFAVSGAIAAYKHLEAMLPKNVSGMLEYCVSHAVAAVEQTMEGAGSQNKKEQAEQRVQEMLKALHLSVPIEVIDTVIESTLNQLKELEPQPVATAVLPAIQVKS